MTERPQDPGDLTPGQLVERLLRTRQTDATDETLRSYENRLGRFLEWCDREGIDRVGDLDGWLLDEYSLYVRECGLAPTTIKGHLTTLRVCLRYAAQLGAVEDDLADAVDVPSLDAAEEISGERLATEDAEAALRFFRNSRAYFGVGMHAFLEVAWHTGARVGGLRALDLGDYDAEERTLHFRHRPETGTGLKNKTDGERLVSVSETVAEALDYYIARERSDIRDEHGRKALWAGRQGRQSRATLRAWSYQATQPCLYQECPHGKRRPTCEWTDRSHCSKCPSSRSPHRIRAGSITWQLNRGLTIEQVAARVNASPGIIRKHYDRASVREAFEHRRRAAETVLDIDAEETHDN